MHIIKIGNVMFFLECRLLAVLVTAMASNVLYKLVASNSKAISQGVVKQDINGIEPLFVMWCR
jgi:hypothetical protein